MLKIRQDAAFQCIINHTLRSLHISITNHPVNPSKVFETFRLSFEYHQPKYSAKKRLVALSNVTDPGEPITVENVRHGLETILRRLNVSENFLQELPGKNFQDMCMKKNAEMEQRSTLRDMPPMSQS